jgi:glycosyltransferase involved in cell wall biosynthesis
MSAALSVVIPTYRRPDLLRRCLVPLLSQTLAASRYEIIVVDDGRDPSTRRLVEQLGPRQPAAPPLRYLQPAVGARGPAAARNCGWRAASGEIIAFTDDDTIPFVDWLSEGLRAMAPGTDAVTGCVKVPISRSPTDYERNVKRLETAEFVTANCFVRRATLERLGGFDERFTRPWREDSDLHFTLLEQRGRLLHAPRAVVLHPVRSVSWGVSLREQRNMLFDALLFKKHPRLYRERIRSRPPLTYYATVLALLALLGGAAAGWRVPVVGGGVTWLWLTAGFCGHRLRGTTRRPRHVMEMIATSAAIPVAAVWWRLAGAVRFRSPFA